MSLRHIFAFPLLTVSAVAMVSTAALADTIDINLSDNSAQLQYGAAMGHSTLGKSEFHAGVLYVDQDNLLGDVGILVKDEVGSSAPGLMVGMGIKGVIATANNNDALALALGGQVRYSPPTVSRLGIVGQVYFSPNIVTFVDADRFLETGARVEYEVIPQAVAYLGYRKVRFGLESSPDATLDEGLHAGVRFAF